jgi:hypothetical protein
MELSSAATLRSGPQDSGSLMFYNGLDLLGNGGIVELNGVLLKTKEKGHDQVVSLINYSAREFLL